MSLDPELEPRVSQYRKVTRRIMLPDGLVIRVGEDIRCPPGSQILDDDDQGGVNEDDDLLQAAAENSGMEEDNEQDMGSEVNIDDIYDGYDGNLTTYFYFCFIDCFRIRYSTPRLRS
jgi:hypothetical protein